MSQRRRHGADQDRISRQRNDAHGVSLRTRLFAGLPAWLGAWRRPARWLVQVRNALPPVAWAAEKLLGLTSKRPLPAPAARPFVGGAPFGSGERGDVWLFVDTFAQHFDPGIAEAAIAVLAAGGYRVRIARPAPGDPEPNRSLCCGRTYLSMGMVGKARAEARRVLAALKPAIESGAPIVGLEPSCLLSMRDEFFSLGLGAEIGALGKNLYLFEEFLARETLRGLKLPLRARDGIKVHVHGHCHQKAFGLMKSVRKTFGLVPGLEFELIDSGCCGMAGSFGFEANTTKPREKWRNSRCCRRRAWPGRRM